MNTDYIVVFGAAIIYGFTAPGPYLAAVLAGVVLPLMIAGIIKIFASTKFSKIYMWTTVILLALSGLGHMMSPYSYS